MKQHLFLFTITAFTILMSCQPAVDKTHEEASTPQNSTWLIIGDIDTIKVIAQLNIKESVSRLNLVEETIKHLSDKVDTLELTYYFGFCDCQRWIDYETHEKALKEHPNLDEPDPRGQIQFNLDKYGFYVEPATDELEVDWRTEVNGTTVRFIGREYDEKRLPEGNPFTVPDPPKGRVFRYYSYQVLKPYHVWGPNKFIEVDEETGDTIMEPTILRVN